MAPARSVIDSVGMACVDAVADPQPIIDLQFSCRGEPLVGASFCEEGRAAHRASRCTGRSPSGVIPHDIDMARALLKNVSCNRNPALCEQPF